MPSSADRQIIEHRPGLNGPPSTRPLKTGREFVVVVGGPRVVQLRWDRSDYDPGDSCKLVLVGRHLGTRPLEFIVEAEGAGGVWAKVSTVRAQADGDQSQAVAEWKFPVPEGHAAAFAAREAARLGSLVHAKLSRCRFEDGHDLSGAQTAWLVTHATGLEGAMVEIVLEREDAEGWAAVGSAVSTVKVGQARAGIPLVPG